MAGIKISELPELIGANATDSDILVIVDVSANETKHITFENLIASNIDSANRATTAIVAGRAREIVVNSSPNIGQNFIPIVGASSGQDSVSTTGNLIFNTTSNKIEANLDGIADSALNADRADVADSANFNLTSINDVVDTFTGLVSGQVLKWNGSAWENQNDLSGDAGSGVLAKQINTVSTTDSANFLIPFVSVVGADSVGVDAGIQYNPATDTLTVANITGNASTASLATLATTATDARQVITDSAAATGTYYPLMRLDFTPGADSVEITTNLNYDASTNTLAATNFSGDGSNISNVAAVSATNATNVAISQQNGDAVYYVHFGSALSGNDGVDVNSKFRINPLLPTLHLADSDSRILLGVDSDFSIDTTGIQYTFNVSNDGASAYDFSDGNSVFFPSPESNPELYLRRGETYRFSVNASGHPFQIRVSDGGSAYNTGVSNNGAEVGNVIFAVPMSAPATLYYQCTIHSGMGNTINIV